jgi:diguanylate cyclase (GGDEF)-like protein
MRRPSVLIVDDDAFSRAVVSRKIAKLSDVVEAEDGFDGLAYLQTADFDLAVVDLEMPNFGGLDLIRSIRGNPKLKRIPVIVVTSNESREALESALTAGATSYLLKPLNWRAFGEHICHVLELAYRACHVAMHDNLTALPNRALLNERLEQALSVQGEVSLFTHILDLDHFKNVNDTLGHPIGDKLLLLVAERLRRAVRDNDVVARMGGDEFAILQHAGSQAEATALAERIIRSVSGPYEIDGHQVVIGASIGIAMAAAHGQTPEEILRNADLALYSAKSNGRSTYRVFEPDMDALMQARRAMEVDLRRALPEGEFQLHYQPVVNLARNEVSGFEALIRWHHPEKGAISPGIFIPLAEEIGLIGPIGAWVIRQACVTAAQWPAHLRVAVNISPAQFRDPDLVQLVMDALATSGLAPNRLELEITETSHLLDNAVTLGMLHQLREHGIRIVTDDFGTGYSSLRYLQSFPFDKIKIDCSFIRKIPDCAASLSIVRAVIGLASGLNVTATAEGVENEVQLDTIRAEGCAEMQGFLLSKPLPADEIERRFISKRGGERPNSPDPSQQMLNENDRNGPSQPS